MREIEPPPGRFRPLWGGVGGTGTRADSVPQAASDRAGGGAMNRMRVGFFAALVAAASAALYEYEDGGSAFVGESGECARVSRTWQCEGGAGCV